HKSAITSQFVRFACRSRVGLVALIGAARAYAFWVEPGAVFPGDVTAYSSTLSGLTTVRLSTWPWPVAGAFVFPQTALCVSRLSALARCEKVQSVENHRFSRCTPHCRHRAVV